MAIVVKTQMKNPNQQMRRSERVNETAATKTTHKYQKETNSYLFIHDRLKRRKSYGKIISKEALQEKLFKKTANETTTNAATRRIAREREKRKKRNENKTKIISIAEWLM